MSIQLTEQQQAIVNHDLGPGLAFAVAGSGKTTAAIARIERLTREMVFDPEKIIVSSFNRDAINSIQEKLKAWGHTRKVEAKTLHGLGYSIINHTVRMGYLPQGRIRQYPIYTLYDAMSQARRRRVWYKEELERIDTEDFLNYVSRCKAQIKYCDLGAANLPPEALKLAKQAGAPEKLTWYLDLYQLFEECRMAGGWITFDDMLLSGWELLHKYPDVRGHFQTQYECVIVDEYQDINLVQSETLDLITRLHRNYMAIGDDDQTIYQWRGATPSFILNFEERYAATKYVIEDNFRCPVPVIALSNQIIVHNENREPKLLSPTKGFTGQVFLNPEKDEEEMAKNLVSEIEALHKADVPPSETTILIRVYAQTPYIEQYLIQAKIPYLVVGSMPFYRRTEIVTLLNYCYVAQLEKKLRANQRLNLDEIETFQNAFFDIYNKPKRYISRKIAKQIVDLVTFHNATIERAAHMATRSGAHWLRERANDFCSDIKWLAGRLDMEADKVLTELNKRLDYIGYIEESAGFPETVRGKVANVEIVTGIYSKGKGSVLDFLRHIEELSFGVPNKEIDKDKMVKVMTIFRTKGLEWDHVFIHGASQGTMPFVKSPIESERRLFYVACTRARKNLYLYWTPEQSEFLTQSNAATTIEQLSRFSEALAAEPAAWSDETKQLVATTPAQYNLQRYFQRWAPEELKAKQKEGSAIEALPSDVTEN